MLGFFERNRKLGTLLLLDFIRKANEKHNFKYNYAKVEYKNAHTHVCIICPNPEHGEFMQMPTNHLAYGCEKCGKENGITWSLSVDFNGVEPTEEDIKNFS